MTKIFVFAFFSVVAQYSELDKAFRLPVDFKESRSQLDSLLALGSLTGDAENVRLCLVSRLYRESDPNKAIEFAESTIERIENTSDLHSLQNIYTIYANSLSVQGNFPAAQRYFNKALLILDELKDTLSLADRYILLAYTSTYGSPDEFEMKREYLNKSFELYKHKKNFAGMGHCVYGLGGDLYYKVYNHPTLPDKDKLLKQALEYDIKADSFYRIANLKDRSAASIVIQGQIYHLMGKASLAKSLIRKAYLIHKKEKGYMGMHRCALAMAKILVAEKKLDSAIFYMRQSTPLLEKANGNFDLVEHYDFQTSIYKSLNNYPEALKAGEMARSYREKSFTVNHLSEVANIKNSYENQLKDGRIKELEAEKKLQRIMTMGGFGIFTIVIGLGSYGYYQRQKSINQMKENIKLGNLLQRNLEDKLQDTQLAALKAQMDPHFIGNAINAVQNLILQEKKEDALIYLNDFSKLTRHALENSKKETISLNEEAEFLRHYVHLEQLRYPGKFDFEIIIDPSVDDPAFERIPPMMIQPFVENAIRHGIHHKTGKGYIKVFFHVAESTLMCTIEDNGVGREAAARLELEQRRSHSTAITDARLELLQKKADLQHRYKIQIEDLLNGDGEAAGTKVLIIIPALSATKTI